jgi:predicted phage baseplate assembly protein
VLSFDPPLQQSYTRSGVTLNANVVFARHGESAQAELLGSGNAAQQNQRFVLKRQDLAFTPAPTRSGVASGLVVEVNGIPWTEVETLYGRAPSERVYTVRSGDDGTVEIEFGDGTHGARLPSGRDNVHATYRTADTAAGGVPAGSLTLLKTHPLGVRSVTNPLPSTGAAGPATLQQARASAPVETTLIGRLVTLVDYEQFAAAFAGITKVRADLLSDSYGSVVYLTVASQDGESLDVVSGNLLRAAAALSDPLQRVEIGRTTPLFFHVGAQLVLAPDAGAEVYARARQALLAAFSIDRRDFGQDVSAAEVIHILQGVPGVVAALLNELYLLGSAARGLQQLLGARVARVTRDPQGSDVTFQPAEILLVHPLEINLSEVSS